MQQQRVPIRIRTPVKIGPYTFKDQSNAVIDLTPYVSATLEVKVVGGVATTTASSITSAASGQVTLNSYTFTEPGTYDLQFYVQDSGGVKVFGEPLQVLVVKNVEDLSLDELLKY